MTTVTATDMQNNFGKYLKMAQDGEEMAITASELISGL